MFTKEELEIFEKKFSITQEYSYFLSAGMTAGGKIQPLTEVSFNHVYSSVMAQIELENKKQYTLPFGASLNAEEDIREAFRKLIELDYNEELFEKYLNEETLFKNQT